MYIYAYIYINTAYQVASKLSSNSITDLVVYKIGVNWGLNPDNRAVQFIDK